MPSVRLALVLLPIAIDLVGCGGGGAGLAPAGCHLVGNEIACVDETFSDCSMAGCSIADLECEDPPVGCQIAPNMILAHYSEKPPGNDAYLCGATQTCGSWTATGCQVTVVPDSGAPIDYTISDATCR